MEHDKLLDSLSPIERAIIPYLHSNIKEIVKKSGQDNTTVLRALTFLENKGLIKLKTDRERIVGLGVNGVYYKKHALPERTLLTTIEKNNYKSLEEIKSLSKLSENEFKAALGVLKRKALINLSDGKISISANKEELTKKFPEESLLEKLPISLDSLKDLDLLAFENLKNRKNIIELVDQKEISFEITDQGRQIAGKEIKSDLIEEVTPDVIKDYSSKLKFRRYDLQAKVPRIFGGKKHFVNQSIEYAKQIWLELGFKEMTGNLAQTSFWNFDALFTPQDHPVREMQDTFFIKDAQGKLPDKKIVDAVKKSHESGLGKSKGWQYQWKEDEAKKVVLRTHTTCLSALTLAKIGQLRSSIEKEGKYFAIGKNFRNETVDWSHGFEFNQTEGIVIGKDLNFRNLLGYLKEFFKKMGYEEIRFRPSYFPYTEPSVEIEVWHPERKIWFELGGAGMFRPEVTIPLLGEHIQVLAWGPGFDRTIMEYYGIKDLREMYSNNLQYLRNIKPWIK